MHLLCHLQERSYGILVWDTGFGNVQEAEVLARVKAALHERKPFTIQIKMAVEEDFVLFNASFRHG